MPIWNEVGLCPHLQVKEVNPFMGDHKHSLAILGQCQGCHPLQAEEGRHRLEIVVVQFDCMSCGTYGTN